MKAKLEGMKKLELHNGETTNGAKVIAKEAEQFCGALFTTTAQFATHVIEQVYDNWEWGDCAVSAAEVQRGPRQEQLLQPHTCSCRKLGRRQPSRAHAGAYMWRGRETSVYTTIAPHEPGEFQMDDELLQIPVWAGDT